MTAASPQNGLGDRRRRLSQVLADLAADPARNVISVVDLRDAMGDRAFGALLFAFAAPNAVPVSLPGVSTVLGAPIVFLALQLALGRATPWLPDVLLRRAMPRATFARAMDAVLPWVRQAEHFLRPRLPWLAGGPVERLIGLACLLLATVLALPIPFGNMPPAVAICVLALALLERDGLAMLAGLAVGAAAMFIAWGVLLGIATGVSLFLRRLLGI